MNHHVAAESDQETISPPRSGLLLFVLYALFYVGFVLINAFTPELMERVIVRGLNLATVYGFALIIVAVLLSLMHGWTQRGNQKTLNTRADSE
ncbi:MAG: DUF485 domain-containing protein [Planctomycetota bacterium]